MSEQKERGRPRWSELKTPLQFLGLAYGKLLVFSGPVAAAGFAFNRVEIAWAALVVAGAPPVAILTLSVVYQRGLAALCGQLKESPAPPPGRSGPARRSRSRAGRPRSRSANRRIARPGRRPPPHPSPGSGAEAGGGPA